MRNLIGIIALSLLAASAGCASDTDTTSYPEKIVSDNPFQAIEENITALATACTVDSTGANMVVTVGANEIAIITKRVVDSAITVNGRICNLLNSSPTVQATPLASKVKRIDVNGVASSTQMVIVDYSNGTFALGATSGSTGINITLGNDANDAVGVKATTGNDVVAMVSGGIRMNTDTVSDVLLTGVNKTTMYLGAGTDSFSADGFGKAVTVYGGDGNDTFNQTANSTINETIYGGAGTDTVTYASRTAAVNVSIAAVGTGNDGVTSENDDITTDVEVVIGGSGADVMATADGSNATLTGGAGNDTLTGGTGNDTLSGGDGNDTVIGGTNADVLNGDAGTDNLRGGAGDDTLSGGADNDVFDEEAAANGADVFNGGTGTDTVTYTARTNALTITMDGVAADDGETTDGDSVEADVENCIGGSAADSITGNALNNILTGGAGNDSLSGGDGDDIFSEEAAATGNDVFTGGDGVDLVDYSERVAAIRVTMGDDTANDGLDSTENDNVGSDIEMCYGGDAADSITGNDLDNEIVGGTGNDTLNGGEGNDIIEGGGGTEGNVIICGAGDGDVGYGKGSGTSPAMTGCEFSM